MAKLKGRKAGHDLVSPATGYVDAEARSAMITYRSLFAAILFVTPAAAPMALAETAHVANWAQLVLAVGDPQYDVIELVGTTFTATSSLLIDRSLTIRNADAGTRMLDLRSLYQVRIESSGGLDLVLDWTGPCEIKKCGLFMQNVHVEDADGNVTCTFRQMSFKDASLAEWDSGDGIRGNQSGTGTFVKVTCVDCTASGNTRAGFWSAGPNPAQAMMICIRCTSTGNSVEGFAARYGAGMRCDDCFASDNETVQFGVLDAGSRMELQHCVAVHPATAGTPTAGVFCVAGATLLMQDTFVGNNLAGNECLVVDGAGAMATIRNCVLQMNVSGVGLMFANGAGGTIQDSRVRYDAPSQDLGIAYHAINIHDTSGHVEVVRCRIDLSGAAVLGGTLGGVSCTSHAVCTIEGNEIILADTRDDAAASYGLSRFNGAHVFRHNTVYSGATLGNRWGMYNNDGPGEIRGNIFSGLSVGIVNVLPEAYNHANTGYNVFHNCAVDGPVLKNTDVHTTAEIFQNAAGITPANLRLSSVSLANISLADPSAAYQRRSDPFTRVVKPAGPPNFAPDGQVIGPTDAGCYAHPARRRAPLSIGQPTGP